MNFFDRLKSGLTKTSRQINAVFASFTGINEDFYNTLEETLIQADVGARLSCQVVETLRETVVSKGLSGVDEIRGALASILEDKLILSGTVDDNEKYPLIILVIGVNGVGKTTTIGKLSAQFRAKGKKVLLCAADTFRAAAGEQLGMWAQRTDADIIRREEGADPASVVFDAISAAKSRGSDVIICDTAGRLHNKTNLMNELSKISRIIDREMPVARRETLLVIDATTGQNGLIQAREFKQTADITGIALTKLDGTAKGGIVFSITGELEIPVKYVGVGEQPDDLLDFDASDFVKAILER